MVISSHILFTFTSQSPRLLVLNPYGEQYVKERATQFPNSAYNDLHVIQSVSEPLLFDHCYLYPIATEVSTPDPFSSPITTIHYTLVKGDGGVYGITVKAIAGRWSETTIHAQGRIPTDVTSMVSLRMEETVVVFAGSMTAQSMFYSVTHQRVMDWVNDQNSPHDCQLVNSWYGGEDAGNFLLYAHGYKRLLNQPDQTNYITEIHQRLPMMFDTDPRTSIIIPTNSGVHQSNYLTSLRLNSASPTMHSHLLFSDDHSTTVYEIREKSFCLLERDFSAFNLNEHTIGVVELPAPAWGCEGTLCVQVWEKGFRVIREGKEVLMTVTEKVWEVLRTSSLCNVVCVGEKLLLQTRDCVYRVIPGSPLQFVPLPCLSVCFEDGQ